MKRTCVNHIFTTQGTISGQMSGERAVRYTIMVRSCFLSIPKNDKESLEHGNYVAQEQKKAVPEALFKNIPYRNGHPFLNRACNCAEYKK